MIRALDSGNRSHNGGQSDVGLAECAVGAGLRGAVVQVACGDECDAAVKAKLAARPQKPGEIAWVTDLAPEPPVVLCVGRGQFDHV